MKYYEVNFTISPVSSDAADLLAAIAGDAGFETFEDTATGLKGYVQQPLFDEQTLRESLRHFPFDGVCISYDVQEADYRDWNEQWEQEGFEPIVIGAIVIHDGRHLPEIDAKMAFGTGTHETTQMICSILLNLDLQGKRILDCGTGTGILSICALKLGAIEAVGYDIDEWSADNARHNAVINRVDDRFVPLLGDASILNKVEEQFDLVMANINRNILLDDLPTFCRKMTHGAMIILSGFYTSDVPLLKEKGEALGLTLVSQKECNSWAALLFNSSLPTVSSVPQPELQDSSE